MTSARFTTNWSLLQDSWNSDEEFLRYLNGLPPREEESFDINHMKISA